MSSTWPVYTLNKAYLQLHCSGTLYLAGLYAAAAPLLAGPKPAAGGLQGQGHDAAVTVTVRARTTHPPEDRLDAPAGRLGSSSSDGRVAARAAHSARLLRVLKAVLWSALPFRRGEGLAAGQACQRGASSESAVDRTRDRLGVRPGCGPQYLWAQLEGGGAAALREGRAPEPEVDPSDQPEQCRQRAPRLG